MMSLVRNETKGLRYFIHLGQSNMNCIGGRTMIQCKNDNRMIGYLFDDIYYSHSKRQSKSTENNSLADSVKQILVNEFHNS